ncbi:MAG: (d)CMP kinase [Pirellulaceae bacterium]
MIVTIDGPAGAGKSSMAQRLAERLGFRFLDTGALYRAVALAGIRAGVDWSDPSALADVARRTRIEIDSERVLLDGDDVSSEIRSEEVTRRVRYAADNVEVRQLLGQRQRDFAQGGDLVTEGRDQGTDVFPQAECKIFLTASPEERARRRVQDLAERGYEASYDEILRQQNKRDQQDASRKVGALVRADDAVELCTDRLSPEQVVDRLVEIVRSKQAGG